jgi:hypothetical protein
VNNLVVMVLQEGDYNQEEVSKGLGAISKAKIKQRATYLHRPLKLY